MSASEHDLELLRDRNRILERITGVENVLAIIEDGSMFPEGRRYSINDVRKILKHIREGGGWI